MTDERNEKIDRYYAFQPRSYPALHRFVVEQRESELELTLALDGPEGRRLELRFMGIRDMKIDWPPWAVVNTDLVEIRDISSRGLEGLVYRVAEAAGFFAFSCRDFEASVK
jgi:hypothetical protein